MSTNSGKLAAGLLLLISVWVGVYWMWEPSKPPITLDQSPGTSQPAAESTPPIAPPPLMKVETTPGASTTPSPTSTKPLAVRPPEFVDYTVQPKDTFESISLKFYGDATHADAITRVNGLGDAARLLTPGRTIRIARNPANLQGTPIASPDAVAANIPERSRPPEPPREEPKPKAEPKYYTVQSGDSLSKIAKKFYGDANQWERIYEANKTTMKGPHDLKLGAVLVIPQ